jgi:hypothetical protein
MSLLLADYDTAASGVTLDRFCGSGITAVNMAAASIMAGMEDLVIGGGCEMMSFTATQGGGLLDAGNMALRDKHPQWHQGICADLIATLEGISRDDVDKLGLESQRRAKIASDEGRFSKSLIPVYNEDGTLALDHDEYPRPQTTLEGLSQLPAVFENFMSMPVDDSGETFDQLVKRAYPDTKINHVHHAGNSSGVVDGSGALLLSSPDYAKGQGWKPRARIVAMANAAGSPELMLNEPGPAARKVVKKAGMTLDEVDSLVNKRSGLLGLCGDNDVRTILQRASDGDERAALAIDVYAYRIRKYIGAYAAALGGLDAVVFTAGVGENAAEIRARAVDGLAFLGIRVDPDRNRAARPSDQPGGVVALHPDGGAVAVLAVATDEEQEIAEQSLRTIWSGAGD